MSKKPNHREVHLTIELPANLSSLLEEVSRFKGISKSEFTRRLIELGLNTYSPKKENGHPRTDELLKALYLDSAMVKDMKILRNRVKGLRRSQEALTARKKQLEKSLGLLEFRLGLYGIGRYYKLGPRSRKRRAAGSSKSLTPKEQTRKDTDIRADYDTAFKVKVAIEAAKEQETLQVLSARFEVSPEQISQWTRQLLEGDDDLFERANKKQKGEHEAEADGDRLLATLGKLAVENEFLKKKYRDLYGSEF
jgi:transposase